MRWCWVNFQCPTIWITVGQGPTALAVGAGGGCLDIFILITSFSPLSPFLWETTQYRMKYCLKGPLNPKQPTNQPKKLFSIKHTLFWTECNSFFVYCRYECRRPGRISNRIYSKFDLPTRSKITVKYYYFQYKNTFYLYCKNFEISLYLSNHMAGDGTNGEGADQTAPLIRGKQVLSGHFSVQVFSVNKTD